MTVTQMTVKFKSTQLHAAHVNTVRLSDLALTRSVVYFFLEIRYETILSMVTNLAKWAFLSVSRQLAPLDNSPQTTRPRSSKHLAPHSFIHYRAKRAAKYMNPRLNVIQIILRSFIHCRTNYSSFFYPLPSLKIGAELPDILFTCLCC